MKLPRRWRSRAVLVALAVAIATPAAALNAKQFRQVAKALSP
jgi:hypothetical protein